MARGLVSGSRMDRCQVHSALDRTRVNVNIFVYINHKLHIIYHKTILNFEKMLSHNRFIVLLKMFL